MKRRINNPDSLVAVTASFWTQVKKDAGLDSCWLWTGAAFGSGYPRLAVRNGSVGAHRFSYELHFGPFSLLKSVCHRCDEPLCVNPSHLFLGTHTENMRDMVAKGRRRGGTSGKLTPDAARFIRSNPTLGYRSLAKKFGVAPNSIRQVRNFLTYRNL